MNYLIGKNEINEEVSMMTANVKNLYPSLKNNLSKNPLKNAGICAQTILMTRILK